MTGRRSHPRFSIAQPWPGALRLLRDVVVYRTAEDEFLAVSQAAGIVGEEMSLELVATGGTRSLKVRVLESRPVILDGAVRHRLRLGWMQEAARATHAPAAGLSASDALETA